jgi:ABC-type oligopeptide transport system substrate-binding subunit
MKKFGIVFLGFLFLALSACKSEGKFMGEWKLVEIDYSRHLETIDPELKVSFQDLVDRQG